MSIPNSANAGQAHIKDILGASFREFISIIKSSPLGFSGVDINKFLVSTVGSSIKGNTNTKAAPNDVSDVFVDIMIAATDEFKKIEVPSESNIKAAAAYVEDFDAIFEEIIESYINNVDTRGTVAAKKTVFEPVAFPYHNSLPHVCQGLNMVKYNKYLYEGYDSNNVNQFINAFKYLYHYISLLDVDRIDLNNLIAILAMDPLGISVYVQDIIDYIKSDTNFQRKLKIPVTDPGIDDIIREAVYNGLYAVAAQIVGIIRNIPVNTNAVDPKYVTGLETNLNTNKANFTTYINNVLDTAKTILVSADISDSAESIYKYIEEFKAIYVGEEGETLYKAADATAKSGGVKIPANLQLIENTYKVYPDTTQPQKDENFRVAGNFYRNIPYMDTTAAPGLNFAKTVSNTNLNVYPYDILLGGSKSSDKLGKKLRGGAPPPPPKVFPPGTGKLSLTYLYGKPDPAGTNDRSFYYVAKQAGIDNATFIHETQKIHMNTVFTKIFDIATNPANATSAVNTGRIAVMANIMAMIENNGVPVAQPQLQDFIIKSIRGYNTVKDRIRYFSNNFRSVDIYNFKDVFVTEFVRNIAKKLIIGKDITVVPAGTTIDDLPKPNLGDAEIWEFYQECVVQYPLFYEEFFNLIRLRTTSVGNGYDGDASIIEANNVPEAERVNYRLNVRKLTGYSRLSSLQIGGADNFGDIVLMNYIPQYPIDGSVGNIWIDNNAVIRTADAINIGPNVLRNIIRIVYNSAPGVDNVDIYGNIISLKTIVDAVARNASILLIYPHLFKNILKTGLNAPPSTRWKSGEITLDRHLLQVNNMWKRNGDYYELTDAKGNVINQDIANNCVFVDETANKCLGAMTACLEAKDKKTYDANCSLLIGLKFNVNPSTMNIEEEVKKMDPLLAAKILKQLRFDVVLKTIDKPIPGFKRYFYESVGTWLEKLFKNDNCTTQTTNGPYNCGTKAERLGKLADTIKEMAVDPSKYNLFYYLEVLVEYVNATVDVLNVHEGKKIDITANYPPPSGTYNMYSYAAPNSYYTAKIRGYNDCFARIRDRYDRDILGSETTKYIREVISAPDVMMPLSRSTFSMGSPFPQYMFGGNGIDTTEKSIESYAEPRTSDVLYSILESLQETTRSVSNGTGSIGNKTIRDIESRISKLHEEESRLFKSIAMLAERYRVISMTKGTVDALSMTNEEFKAFLEKQAGIFSLTRNINTRANKIVDAFQAITDAIKNKVDSLEKLGSIDSQIIMQQIQQPSYSYGILMGGESKKR